MRFNVYTETTAKRDLTTLNSLGYLTSEGGGRSLRYLAGPRMRAWGQFEELLQVAMEAQGDPVAAVTNAILAKRDPQQSLFPN